jgi:hypothetical protein
VIEDGMNEREIVEKLAALDEPLYDTGFGDTDCVLCGAHRPYEDHEGDCPWSAARHLGAAPLG